MTKKLNCNAKGVREEDLIVFRYCTTDKSFSFYFTAAIEGNDNNNKGGDEPQVIFLYNDVAAMFLDLVNPQRTNFKFL